MFKMMEDLQRIGCSQIEASSQSAAALSRGMQQMALEASQFSKRSVEESSTAFARLLGTQSLDGAIQVQADYAKASYEGLLAGCNRFGELAAAMAKDVYRPFEASLEQARNVAG